MTRGAFPWDLDQSLPSGAFGDCGVVLCLALLFTRSSCFKIFSLCYSDSPAKPSQSHAEEGEFILLYGEDVPKHHQLLLPAMQESRTQAQLGTMPGGGRDGELLEWRDAQNSKMSWLRFALRCSSIGIIHSNWIKEAIVLSVRQVTPDTQQQ